MAHNNLVLRTKLRNLNVKSQLSSSYNFRDSQRSHGQTVRWTDVMAKTTRILILIKNIYTMGSKTLPSTCYILSNEYNTPRVRSTLPSEV